LTVLLACTVRGCHRPLELRARTYVCARGHSYDIARSGYVNLLQPQDRRSRDPGDSPEAVGARGRLAAAGIGRPVIDALLEAVSTHELRTSGCVVDLGSGTGDALAAVSAARGSTGIGIDVSTAAARYAAQRFPSLIWVVANADRRLPVVDHEAGLVLSLHGRRNAVDCARVLGASGWLFAAVPAPDDLVQLRTLVQGRRVERLRSEALIAEHASLFEPVERFSARENRTLTPDQLLDLLRTTYRGARAATRDAVAAVTALDRLDVTLASDCVLFRKRQKP
jgi:23S rRNA (guanine745-N1)-methyltransferase